MKTNRSLFGGVILILFFLLNYGYAQNITTSIGQVTGQLNDTITVPVFVNMSPGTSVSAISLAVNYDSTKLACVGSIHNLNPAITSGMVSNCVSTPISRQVRMVWSDLNPIHVNGLFFNMKFKVLAIGQHNLGWDLSVPGHCEYASPTASIIPNTSWINGSIRTNQPITVSLGSATACSGDTVRIPVQLLNASDINAISLAINYNPTNSQFLGIHDLNPNLSTLLVSSNFFGGIPQIRASWAEINSINLNGLAFTLEFLTTGPEALNFDLTNTGNCEITDSLGIPYSNVIYQNGVINTNPISQNTINITTCGPYLWTSNNQTYNTSGIYSFISGCVTNILNLTITTPPTSTITEIIPTGSSFTVCGNSFNTTGVYTVICPNAAANGCDSVVTLDLTVTSAPPSTSIGIASGCVGDTVLIPVTVQNAFGIGSISMAINYDASKIQVLPAVANIYPALAASLLTNSGLIGGTHQFRATWFDLNPVNLQGNLFTLKAVILAPGTHALAWDLNTPGNCEYTDEQAVTIPNTIWNNGSVNLASGCCSAFASISSPGGSSICQGSSLVLSTAADSSYAYQWDLNGTPIQGATNATFSANAAGSYRVTVSQSATCSFVSAAFQVTINPLPAATVTAATATTFCQGSSVVLNANTASGFNYQWLFNGNPIAGATNNSFTANQSGAYAVNITDANGCSANSNPITVTVKSLPVATISGATAICQGGNTVLSANTGTGRTYQWKRNNVNIIGGTQANYTVVSAGTYTVVVTSNGCSATSNAITISVNPLPTVSVTINGSTTFCQGDSRTLEATTDPANTLQWRRNNIAIPGATQNTLQVNTAGAYSVTVNSPSNCSVTSNLTNLVVTTQPPMPTGLQCYEIATFNIGSCSWIVSGTQPPMPTGLACYQTAQFDTISCSWIVTGSPSPVIVTNTTVCDTQFVWQVNQQTYTTSGTYNFSTNCQDYTLNLILNTPAIFTAQPSNSTVNQFTTTTLQVTMYHPVGLNNLFTYQWQRSINNSGFQNINPGTLFSGTQTPTLSINAQSTSLNNNLFRCVVSGPCGSPVASNIATLTVNPTNPINLTIGSANICNTSSNQTISLPINADNFSDIASMTFEITPGNNMSFTGISNRHPNLTGLAANLVNGNIRISWYSTVNANLPNGSRLFNLDFNISSGGSLVWNRNFANFFDEFNGTRLATLNDGIIGVYPSVNPTISNPGILCINGDPVSLIVQPIGGILSGPGISGNIFNPSLSGVGFHNINYSYTSQNGCTETVFQTIEVQDVPLGTAGNDLSICPNTFATLTASGGATYLWSTNETSPIITVNPNATTAYTVQIFNTAGCFVTDTVVVQVNNFSGIQILAGDTLAVCSGANVTLTTANAVQALWTPTAGLSSSTDLNPVANPTATTTYYVTGISATGCVSQDSIVVIVNPIPSPIFSIPTSICLNQGTIDLVATPSSGIFNGLGVQNNNLCNNCPPVFDPLIAGVGIHTINYIYTDPVTGCTSTTSQTLEVLPQTTGSAGPDQSICLGQGAILTANGGTSYLWNTGSTSPTLTVSPSATTAYSVRITGANGCSILDEVLVTVLPAPTAQITGNREICLNGSTQLSVSGFNTIVWSPTVGINNPTSLNPVFNPTTTTTYIAYGTDLNGCSGTDTVTIVVQPLPLVSAGPDMVACGAPVSINASGPVGSSYLWSNGATTSSITVNPTSTNNYSVTITDPAGCSATDSMTVFVPVMFTNGNRSICKGSNTQLLASLSNYPNSLSNLSYSWSPGTALSNTNLPNPIASPTTTTTYTVTIQDNMSGCSYTQTLTVVVLPTPEVELGNGTTIAPGATISLGASIQGLSSGATYSWSLIGNPLGVLTILGNGNSAQFTASSSNLNNTQLISLTVTNGNGCLGTDIIAITIDPLLAGKNVGGTIQYANNSLSVINSGNIFLTGPSGIRRSTNIGPGGNYLFTAVLDSTYTLGTEITKEWGGITVADAQIINDHISNSQLSGLYLLAADVTGDGNILANDAQQTARRAAALAINNSFDNGTGPGNWVNSSQSVVMQGSDLNLDLQVISYGDVNGSYSPVQRQGTQILVLNNNKSLNFELDEILQIPVSSNQEIELGSFQFELEIPKGFIVQNVKNDLQVGNFIWKQSQNKAIILWYNALSDKISVRSSQNLFTITLGVLHADLNLEKLHELEANGYQEFNNWNAKPIQNLNLTIPSFRIFNKTNAQLNVYPNPSNWQSTLSIQIPRQQKITVQLTDLYGKLVKNILSDQTLERGIYSVEIETSKLANGQYIINMTGEDEWMNQRKKITVNH